MILAQARKMEDSELEDMLRTKLSTSATQENMEKYHFWATPSEMTTGTRSKGALPTKRAGFDIAAFS